MENKRKSKADKVRQSLFHRLDFTKLKSKTFSFAKLRGSIARVGNDAGFDRLINSYSYGGLFRNDMAWFQNVQVESFNYNEWGTLPGKVTEISSDFLTDSQGNCGRYLEIRFCISF